MKDLNNPEFVAWLTKPEQTEKYQGITRSQFEEFYGQAKQHARAIAAAIGIETDSIDRDDSDTRLKSLIADGDVTEINGLYWQRDALDDATQEFYKLD